MTLAEALLAVWRQVLVEGKKSVELAGDEFPVVRTRQKKLRTVDFTPPGGAGLHLTGIEQNPATGSQWAASARRGAKILQFSHQGRYIGNVCDGQLTRYAAGRALGL